MGRRRKLTPEQAAELRAWFRMPRSLKAKARELRVSPETIRAYGAGLHKERRA